MYVAVRDLSRNSCENVIVKGKTLGIGSYGTVYETCIQHKTRTKSCNYAVKQVKSENSVEEEIRILTIMNLRRYGPQLIDFWRCDNYEYILQEKWDHDMDNKESTSDRGIGIMLKVASRLDKDQIIHGDLKPDNFLARKRGRKTECTVTDFAFTKIYEPGRILDLSPSKDSMGWTGIPYPSKFVPHLNVMMLLNYLLEYEIRQPEEILPEWIPSEIDFESWLREGFDAWVERKGKVFLDDVRYDPPDTPVVKVLSSRLLLPAGDLDYLVVTESTKKPEWYQSAALDDDRDMVRAYNELHGFKYPQHIIKIETRNKRLMAQVQWEDHPSEDKFSWNPAREMYAQFPYVFTEEHKQRLTSQNVSQRSKE